MFNFSANHLFLISRTEYASCAVLVMLDHDTRRVYRLFDFTKCLRLNNFQSKQIIAQAQATPEGRARIALAAALHDLPQGFGLDPISVIQQEHFLFGFGLRAELEARAGGNPTWNTGVDY